MRPLPYPFPQFAARFADDGRAIRATASGRAGRTRYRIGRVRSSDCDPCARIRRGAAAAGRSLREGLASSFVMPRVTGRSAPVYLLVTVLLATALWLRLSPVFADFPFGDGGLFWVMANDLRENGFVPPIRHDVQHRRHSLGLPAAGHLSRRGLGWRPGLVPDTARHLCRRHAACLLAARARADQRSRARWSP